MLKKLFVVQVCFIYEKKKKILKKMSQSLIFAHFLFFGERCENEWIAHFFEWIAHSLIFGQKTSDSLGNQWANSQPCFLSKNSCKTKGRIRIFTCELDPYLRTGSFCWIRWGQSASVCQIRIHTIYPDLENVAGSGSGKVGTRSMQLRHPNSKTPFMHMLSNDGGTTKF